MAALTGGLRVPSARFRVRQYIPALQRDGVALRELVASTSAYPPAARWLRPLWGCAALASALPRVAGSWRYDVTLLQRELLSTLVTLEPLTKTPRILDVDDAIFLERQGRTARRLAQLCDRVICGNTFLADWFSTWNRDTVVVPTAVDSDRYLPVKRARGDAELVMGWIGTHGNIKYLRTVEPALRRVMDAVPGARLRVVSDRPPDLSDLAPGRVDFVRWSERSEVANIQAMDVGLMPLEDSPWARGKCSFKMLQYMSCGLPVVVSPVGMNAEVLRLGECGVAASTETQWVDGLIALLESPELRSRLAAEGRRVVEAAFSVRVVAPQLARCLRAR